MPFGLGSKQKSDEASVSMFGAFRQALPPDDPTARPGSWDEKLARSFLGRDVPTLHVFMREAHPSVGGGLLRFFLPRTDPSFAAVNGRDGWWSDWPSMPPGVAFASDWLGRLYILPRNGQLRQGEPRVARLDAAAAQFDVFDATFAEFIAEALPRMWRELLDTDLLDAWRAAGGQSPKFDQCVAPKAPLFLGGSATPEGMEITPLVVAVSLAGQMWEQVKDLPPGTPVSGVRLR